MVFVRCARKKTRVCGPAANFDPSASVDDGSCVAENGMHGFRRVQLRSGGKHQCGGCIPVIYGCNLETADGYPTHNYNSVANTHDGSCQAIVGGCIDPAADNYLVPSTPMLLSRGRPTRSMSQFTSDTGPEKAVDGDTRRWWPNLFQAGGNGGYQWWYVHLAYPTANHHPAVQS